MSVRIWNACTLAAVTNNLTIFTPKYFKILIYANWNERRSGAIKWIHSAFKFHSHFLGMAKIQNKKQIFKPNYKMFSTSLENIRLYMVHTHTIRSDFSQLFCKLNVKWFVCWYSEEFKREKSLKEEFDDNSNNSIVTNPGTNINK